MYDNQGISAMCAPSLSGHYNDGLGATALQRRSAALARRGQRKAIAAAKKAAKVAGKTVYTSNPGAAQKLNAAVEAARSQMQQALSLATTAKRTRNKADIQKALVAAQSAGRFISQLHSSGTPPASARRLRGLGYMGACVDDGTGSGTMIDDQTQIPCDPATGLPIGGGTAPGGGTQYPPSYPQTPQYGGGYPGVSDPSGLVPGFGLPPNISTFGQGYAPLRACATGSNLPRCIIYQMAVDEQQQFQYVFGILQSMYAQLLTIVQQLMAQLQSAQQQPYGGQYGQNPYDPYGQNPYAQGAYGQSPYGYGGQYAGPGGGYGIPYASGGSTSLIPPGFDTGGDMSQGVPGDVSQVFPGPSQTPSGGGYPIMAQGGPQPGIISSDSLPAGADQQATGGDDDAAGLIPSAQSGPTLAAPKSQTPVSMSVNAPASAQPQIIVLQQGPGQSPYADASLPAGDRQNQPRLDPPEHDDAGLTGYEY